MRRKFMMNLGSTNWGGGITLNINDLNRVKSPDILDSYMDLPKMENGRIGTYYIEVGGNIFGQYYENSFDSNIHATLKDIINPYSLTFDNTFQKSFELPDLKGDNGIDPNYNIINHYFMDVSSYNYSKGILYMNVSFREDSFDSGSLTFRGTKIYKISSNENGIDATLLATHTNTINYDNFYVHKDYAYSHYTSQNKLYRFSLQESSMSETPEIFNVKDIPNYVLIYKGGASTPLRDGFVLDISTVQDGESTIDICYFDDNNPLPVKKTLSLQGMNMLAYNGIGYNKAVSLQENKFMLISCFYPQGNGGTALSYARLCEFDVNSPTLKVSAEGFIPSFSSNYPYLSWGNKHKMLYSTYTGEISSQSSQKYRKMFWTWVE